MRSLNFEGRHGSKDFVPEGSGDSETVVVHLELEVVIGVLFLQNPENFSVKVSTKSLLLHLTKFMERKRRITLFGNWRLFHDSETTYRHGLQIKNKENTHTYST